MQVTQRNTNTYKIKDSFVLLSYKYG